jgi:hypothetical protein
MKKLSILLAVLICAALMVTGCKGFVKQASDPEVTDTQEENVSDNDSSTDSVEASDNEDVSAEDVSKDITDAASDENTETVSSSNLKTITDLSDYWTSRYNNNEAAINAYEGMPIMELLYPGMCFLTGIQYDLLNLENNDGHYEGDLMLAGYKAFVDKDGKKFTFGYEEVREEDGFSATDKAGDKLVEKGNCDLSIGYYYSENYVERDGVIVDRTVNELKIEKDGSVSAFVLEGDALNYSNEEELSNTYTFVRNGKGQYDFVIARAQIGTDFEAPSLEADMTKEKAAAMFEAAGFTVETSGGIVSGVFTLD